MSVVHTSRMRIDKHEGPHRTAQVEGFASPIEFGVHGGIRHFYQGKYGSGLKANEADRDKVDRTLKVYADQCPAYQSVKGCIDCQWEMQLEAAE